MQPSNLKKN